MNQLSEFTVLVTHTKEISSVMKLTLIAHVMPQQKDQLLIVQKELIHHNNTKKCLNFFFLLNMTVIYYFGKSNSVVFACFLYRV